eukprot:c18458_g1_i2.p1 GENE.c18458_g1_i2~~c18458_g1_i2.p1  ORF type:complete len:867 (+),score=200.75 c18458_g1_i2:41-2602(+)
MIWATAQSSPAEPLLTELTDFQSEQKPDDGDQEAHVLIEKEPATKGLGVVFGVFIPTLQSLMGTVIFLRLGWIVGQQGLLVTLGSFGLAFSIIVVTTLSISAVVTNGRVEAGGVYYIISRSLGPEFGGAIGIAFCLTKAAGVAFNILAFVEILERLVGHDIFGSRTTLILATIVHVTIGVVAMMGASLFSKISATMLSVMLFSWFSAVIALCFRTGGSVHTSGAGDFDATGPSWPVFRHNFGPEPTYTDGNSFLKLFPLFFTAFVGIVTGINLSGDLAEPHKSLPRGSFAALGVSGAIHLFTMCMLAASVPKEILQKNRLIMQDIQWRPELVYIGIMISMAANALCSLVGAARVLQKIGQDRLLPGFHLFASGSANPIRGTLVVFGLTQLVLLMGSIDKVSGILTNFYLLSFATINLACMALKMAGAPNYRPTFKHSNKYTSLLGFLFCLGTMVAINPIYALISLLLALVVFVVVMITAPPMAWGDVSQALIYHQVRKYLLKLDERKQHIRNWRPAILALIDDPVGAHAIMQFGNDIKKGGLYVIGHFLYGSHEDIYDTGKYHSVRRDWLKFFEQNGIKAFPEISVGHDFRAGARALLVHSGLGAMRPNTVLLGLLRDQAPPPTPSSKPSKGRIRYASTVDLPTAPPVTSQAYMQTIADVLRARMSLMITCNFQLLEPSLLVKKRSRNTQISANPFIDVWLTHDVVRCPDTTVGLMLQLSHVLSTQDSWEALGAQVRVFLVLAPGTIEEVARSQLKNQLIHMRLLPNNDRSLTCISLQDAPDPATPSKTIAQLSRAVANESHNSLITFAPLWPVQDHVPESEEASSEYLAGLRKLTEEWGPTVLVHGAQAVVV